MKKFSLLILIMILSLTTVFGCSTSVHISDSSSSITSSSAGETDFSLTIKPTEHGTVAIGEDKTRAKFGESIDIYVAADSGYELVWIKINNGNRAEDKIVYFSHDIHEGVIRNLRVEYNMDIEALFVEEGSIEKYSHSYVGKPTNSISVQTHFNIVSVGCVNGSVSVDTYENIEQGTRVKVTATPNSGYRLNQIVVRDTSDYKLIEVDEQGYFTMPKSNVAIMASFVNI